MIFTFKDAVGKYRVSRYPRRQMALSLSIMLIIIILSTLSILPLTNNNNFGNFISAPSADAALSSSSPLPNLFSSSIYRTSEHVHSIDESVISNHYYSQFVKGYDPLYFAY